MSVPSFVAVRACARVAVVVGALAAPFAASAAPIFSENFSSGLATGAASSSYVLVPNGSFTNPGQYRVVSNPATAFTNGYVSYFDHTSNSASGAMLFFDGAASTATNIYTMFATLTAGQSYTFSFWGSSGSALSPPELGAQVNGVTVGTSLTTTSGAWSQFSATFVAGIGGLQMLRIFDVNTVSSGNDGAIDDVLLVGPDTPPSAVPEPGIVGLIGLGAAAAFMRSRRRAAAK